MHRYENVPPLADKRPHLITDQDHPLHLKSQDLFGLVPFTALTPPSNISGRKLGAEVSAIRHNPLPAGGISRSGLDYHGDDLCDPVIDIAGDEAGVNNLSFEDIGPEETNWNVN